MKTNPKKNQRNARQRSNAFPRENEKQRCDIRSFDYSRSIGSQSVCLALAAALGAMDAVANPQGMTVQSGTASAVANGQHLTVTASHNAFLNWQSFNIGAGETTTFVQPSSRSLVWNRINDQNPSEIYGNLNANGIVVLINQSGFYFGPDSFVSAAGLIVSTAPVVPSEGGGGLFWQFAGPAPTASIINYGQLNVGPGGSAFLIAEQIQNHGKISAPGGNIGLLAGQEVLLSERPDGRGLSAAVTLQSGSVNNSGQLIADAGSIALNARVVNQDGLVQANSVRERNGVIEFFATDSITLGATSEITAQGDDSGVSNGGEVVIKSEDVFADAAGSKISVAGGAEGGDGGFVEVSAPHMAAIRSELDGRAAAGYHGGQLLIDPQDIVIGYSGNGLGSGTIGAGEPPAAGTLNLDVDSSFLGFSQITLQATRDITLSSGVGWDLIASTGLSEPGSLLKLEAGRNITLSSGASILAGENWSVTLQAGRDFSLADTVIAGTGNIVFSGNASLQALNGDINLLAGNNITVGSGHVRTIDGGNINATALGGTINTGTKANGFTFSAAGYDVSFDLGGISTANGGDVNLTAGLDVISYLPIAGGIQTDAGSGAFGAAPGNVTIQAGRDVAGHFVVRNGTGNITAGRNAGTASRLLALSLVNGGWTVNAAQDILLQEVRNPNGLFNNLGSSSAVNRYRFDYAADAYTILNAGNSVQLRGTALPRYTDAFSQSMLPIYPGILEITAGAGGVILGNDLILFPSPLGNLRITTTDGGSLIGTKNTGLTQLIMSDSSKTQYRAFGDFGLNDHAAVPVHLNDPDPIELNIDGDLTAILLGAPKRAEINVGGNMVNSRFAGQNLRDDDVTRINVAGDILNRNVFTSVPSPRPNDTLFDPLLNLIYPPLTGGAAGIQSQFFYDEATGTLTFQGRMTGEQYQALLNLTVRAFDANGQPLYLPDGEPVTVPAQYIPPEVLQQLYLASQDVPLNPSTGYVLGGGGSFEISARNLDLGATLGIVSQGPAGNAALANYFTHGADINVTLTGNLDMFSTKIASHNGGKINVTAGGHVNVGSRNFSLGGNDARGIFTVYPDDVTVIAGGDINVNGSRIAAYDGGNVTVISLHGNIDAGVGGSGRVKVEKIYVDPITREIVISRPGIHGNGIYATTFPKSSNPRFPVSQQRVGDIFVAALEGNITASAGGIVQNPRNGVEPSLARVTLLAGMEAIRDTDGNIVSYAPVFSSGNLVSDQSLADAGWRLRLVDANGDPVLDENGNPVYVTQLQDGDANTVFSDGRVIRGLELGDTLGQEKLRLQLVEPQPGQPDRVVLDANQKPYYVVQLAANDQPQFVIGRNIDVSGSGVVGGNVKIDATGGVSGFIFARGDSDISAKQEVVGTFLTGGNANISAGGDISGTVIGIGGISASGATVDASLLSQNISTSGEVSSSAQQGFSQGSAANATSQAAANDEANKPVAAATSETEEEPGKEKRNLPRLAKTTGRVTVILPAKS